MAEKVKTSIRKQHVELTRSAIAEAGRELFAAQGYVGTTIEQIANRAGVAPSTVYAVYRTKAAVLAEVRWRAVSTAGVPRLEELVADAQTADEVIGRVAGAFKILFENAADVFAAQRAAVGSDPALAENWESAATDRRNHMARLLAPVARDLRTGLSSERAADIMDAMLEFELYDDLVRRRSWTAAAYEEWLREALCALLLRR